MAKDAQEIQSQMQSIRSRSKLQQMQFVDDSARMLDWKEHVRAMPVTALVASVVVGFTLLYKKTPSKSQSIANATAAVPPTNSDYRSSIASFASSLPFKNAEPPKPVKAGPNPLASAAMSMMTSILLSTGKQFILKNLQSILSDTNHERQSKSAVPDKVL